MPVTGLAHFNIRTPLLEETLAFYEAALALRRGPAVTMDDQINNAWLYDPAGNPLVHVNKPLPGEAVREKVRNRLDHVAFQCVDPSGIADRLTAAGIPFETVDLPLGNMMQFNLLDPNGIKVELTFTL